MDSACLALTRTAEAFACSPRHLEALCGLGLITSIVQMVGVRETGSMTSQLQVGVVGKGEGAVECFDRRGLAPADGWWVGSYLGLSKLRDECGTAHLARLVARCAVRIGRTPVAHRAAPLPERSRLNLLCRPSDLFRSPPFTGCSKSSPPWLPARMWWQKRCCRFAGNAGRAAPAAAQAGNLLLRHCLSCAAGPGAAGSSPAPSLPPYLPCLPLHHPSGPQADISGTLRNLLATSSLLPTTAASPGNVLRSTEQLGDLIGLAAALLPPIPEAAAAMLADVPPSPSFAGGEGGGGGGQDVWEGCLGLLAHCPACLAMTRATNGSKCAALKSHTLN